MNRRKQGNVVRRTPTATTDCFDQSLNGKMFGIVNKHSTTSVAIALYRRVEMLHYTPQPTKQLVVNGVWQVPVNERPQGWEKLNCKEPGPEGPSVEHEGVE